MKLINWHYKRSELASSYISRFQSGMTPLIVLFAPRKTGKTEFVLLDLIPQAKTEGYEVVEIDFWSNKSHPAKCIISGFNNTLATLPAKHMKNALHLTQGSSEISLTGGKLSLSAELQTIETIDAAFSLFKRVFEGKGKVLLFLDEIQQLATDTNFQDVVFALRTFIDKNKSWLHVVMTGSSQDGLQAMFGNIKAPLFGHGHIERFELLGSGFVQHMVDCFNASSKQKITLHDALRACRACDHSPHKFRPMIEKMVILGTNDFDLVIEKILPEMFVADDVIKGWEHLPDIDAAVLCLIALKNIKQISCGIFTPEAKEYIKTTACLDKISNNQIKHALDRLRKTGWIGKTGHGLYEFESQEYLYWVKENCL